MELMEKTVERHVLFEGAIVTLRRDKAQLINGQVVSREVVEHPGGVAILPLYRDGSFAIPSGRSSPSCPPESWSGARTTVPPPCGNWRKRWASGPES